MKVSVVVFPGSNCDHDVVFAFERLLKQPVRSIWHQEEDLKSPDLVILPGGFAYGDYLRTGALAKLSPAMKSVRAFADRGGRVLGVCNGFQILCEAGMLPGVLLRNRQMKFLSQFVHLRVEQNSFVTKGIKVGTVVSCPIAHGEGNFFAEAETLKRLEDTGKVIFRYCDPHGRVEEENLEWNPNGSLHAIAGISNEEGNVIGLMPHPERASEKLVGWTGDASCFRLLEACVQA